ncbi:hypothetical protein Bbelb_055500 [Branchiostoma belcheri]|nr:hypothetical protein Bbelb_055500 [Branchiostoma belcheri]
MASNIPFCYFVFATEEMTLLHGPTICRQHRNEPGNGQEEGLSESSEKKERKATAVTQKRARLEANRQTAHPGSDLKARAPTTQAGTAALPPGVHPAPSTPLRPDCDHNRHQHHAIPQTDRGQFRGKRFLGSRAAKPREREGGSPKWVQWGPENGNSRAPGMGATGPGNGSNWSRERATHGAVHGHFLPCTGMYRDRVRAYNVQYTTCTQKVVHFRECTGHVRDCTRFVCRSETPGFYRKPKISGKVCGNFSHGNGGFCTVLLLLRTYLDSGPAWLERSPDWPIERTETPWPDAADADKVLDGDYYSHWNPSGRGPWYIIFDLVVPYTLSKISITNNGDTTHDVSMFLLEASASSDPYSWQDVVTVTEVAASSEVQEFGGFSATGRFWKLNITKTYGTWQPWLREVNFFGGRAGADTCGLPTFRHVPQTDCYSPGLEIATHHGVTLQYCAEACCAASSCLSFQYNTGSSCFLKTKLCSEEEKTSAASGNMYDWFQVSPTIELASFAELCGGGVKFWGRDVSFATDLEGVWPLRAERRNGAEIKRSRIDSRLGSEGIEHTSQVYTSLGCWSDSADRAIPTLEGTDPRLDGKYRKRTDPIGKCYQVARSRGFTVFGVQDSGQCFGSADAHNTYNKHGPSIKCKADGEGGPWALEVYQITDPLPLVDGSWSEWTSWSICEAECGLGNQSRSRICDSPRPQGSGANCTGHSEETQGCDTGLPCPVSGNWSQWTYWSSCDVTCGSGNQSRSRSCDNPPPQHGGANCTGSSTEVRTCDSGHPCAVSGNWSHWTSWSSCDVTCGFGNQSRSRSCDNPPPQHGGVNCTGSSTEVRTCDCGKPCAGRTVFSLGANHLQPGAEPSSAWGRIVLDLGPKQGGGNFGAAVRKERD